MSSHRGHREHREVLRSLCALCGLRWLTIFIHLKTDIKAIINDNSATAPGTVTSSQWGFKNGERRQYSERLNGAVSIFGFAQGRKQAAAMADVVCRAARPDHGGDRRHRLDPVRPRRPARRVD